MLMDKMTEMVAHMIGIFHTTIEDERMRDTYDKFKALQAADPEIDPIEAMGITFKAKYTLEGFTPGLRYSDQAPSDARADIASPFYNDALYPIAALPAIVLSATNEQPYPPVFGHGPPQIILQPASSVVVIVAQSSFLSDNDLLLLGTGETVFRDPAEFLIEQQQYQTIAAAIAAPVDANMIVPGENAAQDAIALHTQVNTAQATTLSGASAQMLHGEDATGTYVNGNTVDEAPVLDDLWPEFKSEATTEDDDQEDDQEDDSETPIDESTDTPATAGAEIEDTPKDHEFPDPFEGLDEGYSAGDETDIEDGHAVVTGGNLLVNEVAINSAWLDAPVISVMEDVISLNVISQVNVLVDQDYGALGELVSSTAMNAATLAATATTPAPDDETAAPANSDLGLPSNWAVTRIEGDLIAVNQISQFNFVTDNDRAEVTFSSSNTFIGMGENTVINLASLSELGFGYDLIMIGGSMISVNWISQMNVLIDNDVVVSSGDTAAGFSGSDNLLFNSAMINTTGVDSYSEMQSNFASANNDLADGGLTIGANVAQDSLFEGMEFLRVLYIEGDLTTINWIEQTNILGDSDQVNLALENLVATTGASPTVTTGSNSLVNVANINEFGVDSTIAVNGDVYDDALLYQAELIDTDADPLGVNMPALLNEAVVFLAEDMLSPDLGPMDTPITATAPESTASSDVMQSMLA